MQRNSWPTNRSHSGCLPVQVAQPVLEYQHAKLTTQQAQIFVAAAMTESAGIKVPVNIAAFDAGGYLKAFLRMDGRFWRASTPG